MPDSSHPLEVSNGMGLAAVQSEIVDAGTPVPFESRSVEQGTIIIARLGQSAANTTLTAELSASRAVALIGPVELALAHCHQETDADDEKRVLAAVVRRLGAAGITGAYIFGATFRFRPEEDQTSFDPWSRQLRAVLKSAGVAEPTVVLFGDGRRVALHSDGSLEADNGSTMRLLRDSDEIIAPAAPEQDRLTIVPIRAAAVKAVKVAKVVEQAPAKQSSPPQPVPKVRQQAAVQPRPGNNRETLRRLWTFLEANGVDVMDIIGGEKTKNGVYSKHGEERQAAALVLLDPSVPSSAAVAEKLRTTEEIVNRTSRTILIHAAERLKELGIPVDPELLTLLAPRQQHKESDVPLHPVAVDIRDLRKSLGWSQERLAQMVDRSIYTIQRFEVGHTLPERGVVEQLYAALGVSQLETAKKLRGYKSGREARESTNR